MIQTVLETGLFPAIHAPSVFGGKIMHKRSEVRSSVVSYPAYFSHAENRLDTRSGRVSSNQDS